MRFGQRCQGRGSHEALVALQDAEIRLLENIKKCLTLRVKVDRDYANGLGELVAAANRLDTSDFKLPVFQAWSTIVKETEAQQRLIQENTEILCRRTLDRVCHLINEKKAARKYYVEERQRLEVEFQKLQEEPQKQKGDYEKLMEKFKNENTKFEVQSRGKSGSKSEDARNRVCKAAGKLHKTHNDYIVSLHDVTIHQRHYLTTTLPGLLNYQQEVQEAMINQSKQVLEEYVNLTNTSNEKFTACQRRVQQVVAVISKDTEYVEYVEEHKSDPLGPTTFEFDKNLLNDYNGKLTAGDVAVDDLTLTSLKECGATILERITNYRRRLEAKENELKTLEESLSQKLPDKELTDETRRNFEMQQQAVLVLKKEIAELNCIRDKNQGLYTLVNEPVEQVDDAGPPHALDLPSPPPELESDGSSSSSKVKLLDRITALIKSPRPQPLPHPDRLDNGGPSSFDSEAGVEGDGLPGMDRSFSVPSDGYQQYVLKDGELQMTLQPSQLEDMEWFHGVLPREEVQRLLVNDGDFLVRESKNRRTGQTQHVLSVMWSGHKHFIIQGQEGSWRFEGNQYPSIPELVIQQYQSNLPVTNKSQAILSTPIVREDWEINNDDIEQAEKIDNGHFGEVFRGHYKVTKQEVAIKICRETLSEDAKKKFLLEGRILKQYDHPNIVKFIGIAAQRQPVMIVMEFVSGGSLLKFLQSKGSQQTARQLIKMCEDAAAGMAYLEDKGCIHRDLAARNCLVGKNQVVKISDFGMSREEEVYKVSDGLKQIPIKWTAPEALNLGEYTSMCDVWSYGVLMWEVFSHGDLPYNGQTNNQAREKIETGYRMPAPEGTPELVYALMLRCWDAKPTNRPHFTEVHQELGRLRTIV